MSCVMDALYIYIYRRTEDRRRASFQHAVQSPCNHCQPADLRWHLWLWPDAMAAMLVVARMLLPIMHMHDCICIWPSKSGVRHRAACALHWRGAVVHKARKQTFLPDGGPPPRLRRKFRLPRRALPLEGALACVARCCCGIATLHTQQSTSCSKLTACSIAGVRNKVRFDAMQPKPPSVEPNRLVLAEAAGMGDVGKEPVSTF